MPARAAYLKAAGGQEIADARFTDDEKAEITISK